MDDMPSLATTTTAPPLSTSDTDELLDLLSNTIRSLANDAAAVRQMTDLADVLEYSSQPNAGGEAANDDDNGRGGGGQHRRTRRQLTTQLYDLDNVITIMEGKVEELKDIINHEKAAIVEFETSLLQEAEEQERLIKSFQEHVAMKDKSSAVAAPLSSPSSSTTTTSKTDTAPMAMTSTTVATLSSSSSSTTKRVPLLHSLMNSKSTTGVSSAATSAITLTKSHLPVSSNRLATPGMKRAGTTAETGQQHESKTDTTYQNTNSTEECESEHDGKTDSGRDGQDQQDGGMLKFEMVTPSELAEHNRHSVPFGTSRISRMDLNEALEEIEVVVHKKVKLSKTTQKKVLMHDKTQESYVTTNSLQRRFDYLQQRHRLSASKNLTVPHLTSGPGSPVHTSGHGNLHHNDAAASTAVIHTTSSPSSYPVSEQELRENCAFFRHGESTARSTLSMLCNLKRLRQIPMKSKDDITYVCLFKGGSRSNKNSDNGVDYYDRERPKPSSSLPSWSP